MKRSLFFLLMLSLPFFGSSMSNALNVAIAGNGYTDNIVVRFDPQGSTDYNSDLDAWKLLSNNPAVGQCYTQVAPNERLSVYAMPLSALDTVIDLHAYIAQAGTYTIQASEYAAFLPGECIRLEDVANHIFYDLRAGTAINFALPLIPLSAPAPFRIHFSSPPTITSAIPACFGLTNGTLIVSGVATSEWSYTLLNTSGTVMAADANLTGTDSIKNIGAGNYQMLATTAIGCSYIDTLTVNPAPQVKAQFVASDTSIQLAAGGVVYLTNQSQDATSYLWSFNDGSGNTTMADPSHLFMAPGDFQVTLKASNGSCSATAKQVIHVHDAETGIQSAGQTTGIQVTHLPNQLLVTGPKGHSFDMKATIYDLSGRELLSFSNEGASQYELPLQAVTASVFIIRIDSGSTMIVQKMSNVSY
jgi:hypothetical protein